MIGLCPSANPMSSAQALVALCDRHLAEDPGALKFIFEYSKAGLLLVRSIKVRDLTASLILCIPTNEPSRSFRCPHRTCRSS